MFDLPTYTREDRHKATKFRNYLLDEGFNMIQYSVYQRYKEDYKAASRLAKKIRTHIPEKGKIVILMFTDKQYENMLVYEGAIEAKKNHPKYNQLELF